MTERIDMGGGLVLEPSTDGDFEEVYERIRDWDLEECRCAAPKEPKEKLGLFERCWSIVLGGELLGFVGFVVRPDHSPLSRERYVSCITTRSVWRHPKEYVRRSKEVLAAVSRREPPWVEKYVTATLTAYEGAIKWEKRILGFRETAHVEIGGRDHTMLEITRREAENG